LKKMIGGQSSVVRVRLPGVWSWRRILVLGLVCALLPGCSVNLTRIFVPLAYAGIGTGIALLVSPSVTAAIVGFVLGGIIGAAVYNNSLKTDLMERQDQFRSSRP
jgi:putative Mn2+ efflux pump MntP